MLKNESIEQLVAAVGAESQLKIQWVRNSADLDVAVNNGIIELYKNAFAEPPYNEKFDDGEVLGILGDVIKSSGFLFTAMDSNDLKRIIAFVASIPVESNPGIAAVTDAYGPSNSFSYFAEDVVDGAFRRRGISSYMKDLLLQANAYAGYQAVILRTSGLNFKQISAVAKSGAKPLAGVFQEVTQTRQDGSIQSDKRGFYMFDLTKSVEESIRLQNVIIARPGGNETAIVWDAIPRDQQAYISKLILAQSPIIEQVMFAEQTDNDTGFYGQMAGGEFCGNATRSFGYLLLNGKDGVIDVNVSGTDKKMRVEVKDGQAKTQIPIKPNLESVTQINNYGDYIVNLDGISFLITSPQSPYGQNIMSIKDQKSAREDAVKKILKDVSIINNPASGVMIVYDNDGVKSCDPFVYVKSIDTLYYETGCGSGSTAVGMVESIKSGKSISKMSIVQPSGLPLIVTINRDEASFLNAFVDGPVEILARGPMILPTSVINPAQQQVVLNV